MRYNVDSTSYKGKSSPRPGPASIHVMHSTELDVLPSLSVYDLEHSGFSNAKRCAYLFGRNALFFLFPDFQDLFLCQDVRRASFSWANIRSSSSFGVHISAVI